MLCAGWPVAGNYQVSLVSLVVSGVDGFCAYAQFGV